MEERLLESETNGITGLQKKVWGESKRMWKVTFPAILSRLSSYGVFVVTQAFIGHTSSSELAVAAYSLLQILGIRFVTGILLGMSSATETLCGQAFGAKQYHMLGIYLQRSWIVNLISATLLVPIFLFAKPIFKLLGEDDDIAEEIGYIAPWFIPIIYFFVFSLTIQQYLQCQLKNRIIAWLSAAVFVTHVFLSWLLVVIFNWGVPGAMSAMIISTWSVVIGEFVYIFGGWCPSTWRGFTSAAFADLWPVVKLSASSGAMLCLEMWYTAILVLLASYMKNASVAISAFSICLNICAWEFMISLGFLVGASVRVSNELGHGNAKAAQFSIKVNLGTSISIGVFFSVLFLFLGRKIAYIFTSDKEVAEVVSGLTVLLGVTILLRTAQAVFSGVAVGSGRQGIAAWVNIGSYYVIGVPIGVVLAYVAHFGVRGVWIGMLIGILTQTMVLGFIVLRTNWEEQVEKSKERLNRWFLRKPGESPDDPTQQMLNGISED